MESSRLEDVVDRLEETYDFDKDEDNISSLYFKTHYDCGGKGILLGDVILFSTADDGAYKPDCREWSEDDIYDKCVARLNTFKEALSIGPSQNTIILDLLNERIRFHESIPLKSQVADPDARNIIDRDASLRELRIILNELSKLIYRKGYTDEK